jgi:glycogen operon protein
VEGPSDDPNVIALRERQKRNLMATLIFSEGVPMLLAGDELSHTQKGNNNAYCQDNELSWLNWDVDSDPRKKRFLEFVQRCATIFREQPVLQRRKFFHGRAIRGDGIKDVSFFAPSGKDMTDEEWNAPFVNCLGMRLAGDLMNEVDERGEPIVGDTLLLLLNHHWEEVPFVLPPTSDGQVWETMIDTRDDHAPQRVCRGGEAFPLFGRSLALLRTVAREEAGEVASTPQLEAMRKEIRRPAQSQPHT